MAALTNDTFLLKPKEIRNVNGHEFEYFINLNVQSP
jgi:hypothetical protein